MRLGALNYNKLREWRVGLTFASSSFLSGFVSMLIGILMIRWIEPGDLGIWQSLSILQLYIPFLELGIPNGLNRELPYLLGKGDNAGALKHSQAAQSFMIVIALVIFLATLFGLSIMFALSYDARVISGVVTVGLMVSINAYQRYLTVTFRSSQNFIALSKLYIYQTGAQIILCPLVFYYEYYGLLVYSLLVLLVFTALMHIHRPITERPKFDRASLVALAKTGMPVFVMNYFRGVSSTFSRLVLLLKSGTLSVGLFTPVMAVGTLITMLPGVLANYFFPKMNHQLGSTDDPRHLWPMVVKINAVIFLCALPFIAVVWIATPYVISAFFDKYSEAIPAMQIFSLNFLFAGTSVSHNAIYSIKEYRFGYVFSTIEFVLRFICPYLLVHFFEGNTLSLTAYGVLLSNALLFCLNIALVRSALFKNQL
jgi:O-antigen/teichoic acid export membrane protein